jgi:hypothetical protein
LSIDVFGTFLGFGGRKKYPTKSKKKQAGAIGSCIEEDVQHE